MSTVSAIVAGTLFALSPYALVSEHRSFLDGHLSRAVCRARPRCCWLPDGCPSAGQCEGRYGGVLLAGCALLGFNYVYYAFFACFFIGLASLVGFRRPTGNRRILVAGSALRRGDRAAARCVNLAPSLYSWSRHGRPMILRDKVPAESEVYGLKIRQLVSPVFQHPFPPFRRWTEKEAAAHFPLETENMDSRLGLVGSVGFLGLLGAVVRSRRAAARRAGHCCSARAS